MTYPIILKRSFSILTFVALQFVFLSSYSQTPAQTTPGQMQAHFINVGQADAALLEFPCGAVLIDAGAEDATTQQNLINYLKSFFTRRKDLNNTLDLVIISHDHIDHDFSLKAVAQAFHVKNYIDNGHTVGSGEENQGWMEHNAQTTGIKYESFSYEQVTANNNHNGLTDAVIEPIHCSTTSPKITVLSGRFQSPTDLADSDYRNENNHSLVVKVQYGTASFLFTGDLENGGMNKLLSYYKGSSILDVDVWKVSHHGSNNGTETTWLQALTPKYAVISCGQWNDGMNSTDKFNTYNYGHPRIFTLNLLAAAIPGNRPAPITVKAATAVRTFINATVTKNIYDTAWDGNITIKATATGQYTVVTHDQ